MPRTGVRQRAAVPLGQADDAPLFRAIHHGIVPAIQAHDIGITSTTTVERIVALAAIQHVITRVAPDRVISRSVEGGGHSIRQSLRIHLRLTQCRAIGEVKGRAWQRHALFDQHCISRAIGQTYIIVASHHDTAGAHVRQRNTCTKPYFAGARGIHDLVHTITQGKTIGILAITPIEYIVTATAYQFITVFPTQQFVIAVVATQHVIAAITHQQVCSGTAFNGIVKIIPRHDLSINRSHTVDQISIAPLAAIGKGIGADRAFQRPAHQHRVAGVQADAHIGAAVKPLHQQLRRINAAGKAHRVVALIVKYLVAPVSGSDHKDIIARAAKERVVAPSARHHISAITPHEPVSRRTPADLVIARAAIHGIALVAAQNDIGLRVATYRQWRQLRDERAQAAALPVGQFDAVLVGAQQGVCDGDGCAGCATTQREHQVIRPRGGVGQHHVAPGRGAAQADHVGVLAVVDAVGRTVGDDIGVRARAAQQQVIARAGLNQVIGIRTPQFIRLRARARARELDPAHQQRCKAEAAAIVKRKVVNQR